MHFSASLFSHILSLDDGLNFPVFLGRFFYFAIILPHCKHIQAHGREGLDAFQAG